MEPLRKLALVFLVLCPLFLSEIAGLEHEMTVSVQPRREDCFYQNLKLSQVIDLEYQVIDGSHGDLDISFHLYDPTGRLLQSDFKKSENNYRVEAKVAGDHKFCFDNTFSSFNSKTIFFEFIVESDGDEEWNPDLKEDEAWQEESHNIKFEDLNNIIHNVKVRLGKIRHLQDMIKSHEARDRNIAEENFFKVNSWSMIQIVVMLAVGFVQVLMVKSLFDDKSRFHQMLKKFHS